MAAEQLSSRDAGYLSETTLVKLEEESPPSPTKPVLLHLEYTATTKVRVSLLYTQRHHGVHHVLELLRAGHRTRLINLADDDGIAKVFFTVVGHHTE